MRVFYTGVVFPLVYLILRLLSLFDSKVREGFRSRSEPWPPSPPEDKIVIWFHVSSGEIEYAKPVIRDLKKRPDIFVLVTYFSPSVVSNLKKTPEIDAFVPMPWDLPLSWQKFIQHFSPEVLAIARTDTWPQMVWQAKRAGIPSILFSATLPRTSARVASFWGRLLYSEVVENIDHVSCVAAEDREGFEKLSSALLVSVDGDTRFDQVIQRLKENRPTKSLFKNGEKVFVCGSTWPNDEDVILPALPELCKNGLKVILVPHEPTEKHLIQIETELQGLGLKCQRYSKIEALAEASVVLIDVVGILADLYKRASVAFVGGSFQKSVHSVMEPLAAGCLTLVGPYHYNNREALQFKKWGFVQEIENTDDLMASLRAEISRSDENAKLRSEKIKEKVEVNAGVSQKISDWIRVHMA